MNRPIRLNAVALSFLCAIALSGCGSTPSDPVVEGMDTIGVGATFGGEVALDLTTARPASAPDTDAAEAATTQLTEIAQDPDVQEALYGLSWDVGCGIATRIQPDEAEVRTELLRRALDLGLVFADQATVDLVVDGLMDAFDVGVDSDLETTCLDLGI